MFCPPPPPGPPLVLCFLFFHFSDVAIRKGGPARRDVFFSLFFFFFLFRTLLSLRGLLPPVCTEPPHAPGLNLVRWQVSFLLDNTNGTAGSLFVARLEAAPASGCLARARACVVPCGLRCLSASRVCFGGQPETLNENKKGG